MRAAVFALALTLSAAGAARAEVAETWDTGFTLKSKVEVAAPPARAYAAIGEVGKWWNGAHTYSGSAANMTLPLQPGACFCEILPGGGVVHGRVVQVRRAQGLVRVDAALGPLQEMGVAAALTFVVKPAGAAASTVEMTYTVGGGRPGFAKMLAVGVDGVMSDQLARYGKFVQTGKPE
jgi:uncharacterized protein YndB with AHSA1/START domain